MTRTDPDLSRWGYISSFYLIYTAARPILFKNVHSVALKAANYFYFHSHEIYSYVFIDNWFHVVICDWFVICLTNFAHFILNYSYRIWKSWQRLWFSQVLIVSTKSFRVYCRSCNHFFFTEGKEWGKREREGRYRTNRIVVVNMNIYVSIVKKVGVYSNKLLLHISLKQTLNYFMSTNYCRS